MIGPQTLIDERYRILGLLGTGGMSEVYLCRDEVLCREVALKVLRERYAEDEEFVERFVREARSAAALSHPNIASVYDGGRSRDGYYYIAMEYLCRGTLAEYLDRRGPLPVATAAAVAEQIASALAIAHEQSIVHRDVKPQNIIVTGDGDVKLTDFGIARATASAALSEAGRVLGTVSYMSPEQAKGEQTTPRSDLYALGCVLYEMLTGEAPFDADTPLAVSVKHIGERPRPPAELNPQLTEDMDAVVMRLLEKEPAGRYESAEALVEDLRRLRDGLSVAGADAPVSASAASAPVFAGGSGGGSDGAAAVVSAATTSGKSPQRRKRLLYAASLVVVALLGAMLLGLSRGPGGGGVIGTLEEAPGNVLEKARGIAEGAERTLLGPQEATIPAVEGLSEKQARQRLEERGFGVKVRPRQSSESATGTVLEQSAPGGERVEQGSTILLAVGDGPPFAASGNASGGSSGYDSSGGTGDGVSGGDSVTNSGGEDGMGNAGSTGSGVRSSSADPPRETSRNPSDQSVGSPAGSYDQRSEPGGGAGSITNEQPPASAPATSPAPEPPRMESDANSSGASSQGSPPPATQEQTPTQAREQPMGEVPDSTERATEIPETDTDFPAEVPLPDSAGSSMRDLPPSVPGGGSAGNAADQYASGLPAEAAR